MIGERLEDLLPWLAMLSALLELWSLRPGWRTAPGWIKAAPMVFLFLWLRAATGLTGAAFWFGAGLLLSLAGDILLLRPERFLAHGRAAFLLAHTACILGFNSPPPDVSFWGLLLAVFVGLGAARLLRRILAAARDRGEARLTVPISAYAGALTLMLLAALLTLSNTRWQAAASVLVSCGASCTFGSDLLLAWDRFIAPIEHAQMLNTGLYRAGQIALIAGVVMQFS